MLEVTSDEDDEDNGHLGEVGGQIHDALGRHAITMAGRSSGGLYFWIIHHNKTTTKKLIGYDPIVICLVNLTKFVFE